MNNFKNIDGVDFLFILRAEGRDPRPEDMEVQLSAEEAARFASLLTQQTALEKSFANGEWQKKTFIESSSYGDGDKDTISHIQQRYSEYHHPIYGKRAELSLKWEENAVERRKDSIRRIQMERVWEIREALHREYLRSSPLRAIRDFDPDTYKTMGDRAQEILEKENGGNGTLSQSEYSDLVEAQTYLAATDLVATEYFSKFYAEQERLRIEAENVKKNNNKSEEAYREYVLGLRIKAVEAAGHTVFLRRNGQEPAVSCNGISHDSLSCFLASSKEGRKIKLPPIKSFAAWSK